MIRKFNTRLRSGKIELETSKAIEGYLKGRKDGACVVEVITGADVERRLRSSAQNRYYWGICVNAYLQAMIDTGDKLAEEVCKQLHLNTLVDAVHELLKFEFAGCEVIDENTGEVRRLPMSTASMTTVEIGVYWDKIRASCLDRYGVDIPPPPDDVFAD